MNSPAKILIVVVLSATTIIGCSHTKCEECSKQSSHNSIAAVTPTVKKNCTTCSKQAQIDPAMPVVKLKACPGQSTKSRILEIEQQKDVADPTLVDPPVRSLPGNLTSTLDNKSLLPMPTITTDQLPTAQPKEPVSHPSQSVQLGHARDYTWIVGQLQYLHTKKQWRVRYSTYDIEDKYGGSVTIIGEEGRMERFREGDVVRVRGRIVENDSHRITPDYYVESMTPVE